MKTVIIIWAVALAVVGASCLWLNWQLNARVQPVNALGVCDGN